MTSWLAGEWGECQGEQAGTRRDSPQEAGGAAWSWEGKQWELASLGVTFPSVHTSEDIKAFSVDTKWTNNKNLTIIILLLCATFSSEFFKTIRFLTRCPRKHFTGTLILKVNTQDPGMTSYLSQTTGEPGVTQVG